MKLGGESSSEMMGEVGGEGLRMALIKIRDSHA